MLCFLPFHDIRDLIFWHTYRETTCLLTQCLLPFVRSSPLQIQFGFLSLLYVWLKGTAWKIDAVCTHGEVKESRPHTLTIHLLLVYWFVGAIMSLSPSNEIIQGMEPFIVWSPLGFGVFLSPHHQNFLPTFCFILLQKI